MELDLSGDLSEIFFKDTEAPAVADESDAIQRETAPIVEEYSPEIAPRPKDSIQEQLQEVDFYIRMTDHKKVGGLTLPHKLTFLTESEVSEEFEISKYQVNPQFKADLFEKH